jgi:predicted nucleic acid-binding protein
MPVLRYLADTNSLSDYQRGESSVREWFSAHRGEVALSVFTLAEMRQGVELKDGRARLALERKYRFVVEDYRDATFVFDEAAAAEWGRLKAESRNQPIPLDDSYIGAIARVYELTVVTRNARHFPGCHTVDPWTGQTTAPR